MAKQSTRRAAVAPPRKVVEAGVSNLEMRGDRLKVYALQNLLAAKQSFRARPPERLAEVLEPWYEKSVAKPGAKLGFMTDLWMDHVPEHLVAHTRLAAYSRGTLTVQVRSAPIRAELEALFRQGLLRKLQGCSKGAIYRIKTRVDGTNEER